jgi:hypothetical protein
LGFEGRQAPRPALLKALPTAALMSSRRGRLGGGGAVGTSFPTSRRFSRLYSARMADFMLSGQR